MRRMRAVFPALPLLYFAARAYFISAETNTIYMDKDSPQEKVFSVAEVNENKPPADYMKSTFYGSAQVSKSFKKAPDYSTSPDYLKEAKEKKLLVNITLASVYSNTIMNVKRTNEKD